MLIMQHISSLVLSIAGLKRQLMNAEYTSLKN
jgi:hypothetical protein